MSVFPLDTPDQRWARVLDRYLGTLSIQFPDCPLVLDLGCGNNAIWNYLALVEYLGTKGRGVPRFIGVDIRAQAFSKAQEALEGLAQFVACDARELTKHVEGPIHLALCQHPPLTTSSEGPKIWKEIFEELAKLLDPCGCLLLTSFWINDHIPALVSVKKAGLEVVYNGKNAFPGKVFDQSDDGEQLQYDKYILVARRARS